MYISWLWTSFPNLVAYQLVYLTKCSLIMYLIEVNKVTDWSIHLFMHAWDFINIASCLLIMDLFKVIKSIRSMYGL